MPWSLSSSNLARAVTVVDRRPAPHAAPDTGPATSSATQQSGVHQTLADRYQILGLLGVGGMGSVYRALDRELEEVVALKMLRRELIDIPGILERFRREVKLARRVTHKNVARVFDIGEHEGEKFLTMEFVDGEPLSAVIARQGAFDVARALDIVSGICAGLASAHAAGVIHRDLKPDNVLIAKDGRVVITDFGIARALLDLGASQTAGMILGTPAYMAPEQVEGKSDIDARADIYALGVLLFELFTGQRAWTGDSALGVAAARLLSPPPDPRRKRVDLPTACAEVVMRCMAQKREDRFEKVEQIAAELSQMTLPVASAASSGLISVRPPKTEEVTSVAITPAPADKTVAVLPFRNSGPPDDDYLAEELTDDLIDNLSMTRGLKVRSRSAVARFKGVERDSREIGREIDVQVVVEGSVRRARGNVRISARLISVAEGFQLWAKRFDRPEQDVLSINDEAASAIAAALTLDREAEARVLPSNPAAVDLYLRARHEYRHFWTDSEGRAIALFEQAEALSPGDPMILSGKAMAMARRAFFLGTGAEQALAVARQAVAVAPQLAEARLAIGTALLHVGEWTTAARELKLAVARGPGLADAHSALGRLLSEAGALHDSNRYLEAALSLDPRIPLTAGALARNYALLGDWAKLDEVLSNPDLLKANRSPLGRFLMWKRDVEGAKKLRAEMERIGEELGAGATMLDVIITGKLPAKLQAFPESSDPRDIRRRTFLLQIDVEASAYIGDLERAISGLQQGAEAGIIDIAWIDRCPLFDKLRADPRFAPIRSIVKQRADEILAAYRAP